MNSYLRILNYLKPLWKRGVQSLGCTLVLAALATVPALLAKYVVDDLFISKDIKMLTLLPGAILLTYVLKGIFAYGQSYLMFWLGQRVVMEIRDDLYHQALADAILRLLRDPQGAATIGSNAHDRAKREFRRDLQALRAVDVYRTLLSGQKQTMSA